jgi:hypothetical protein
MHDPSADLQQDLTDVTACLSSQTHISASNASTQQQQAGLRQPPRSSNDSSSTRPPPDADAPVSLPTHHSSTDDSGSGAWQIGTHKRTLFAGYVSFQQILDFMEGSSRTGRSLLDSWLKTPKAPQKDKVVMTGPGGMGRCEVAVTKTEVPGAASNSSSSSLIGQQGQQQNSPGAVVGQQLSAGGAERQGLLQRGLQRARFVATGVQQALDVLSDLQSAGGSASHMLCALMTLRLPVHYLVQELLAAV